MKSAVFVRAAVGRIVAVFVIVVLLAGGLTALVTAAQPVTDLDPQVAAPARRAPAAQAIVINHTTADISQIPPYWIEQAKALLRASYGHTSHGSQLVSGMSVF